MSQSIPITAPSTYHTCANLRSFAQLKSYRSESTRDDGSKQVTYTITEDRRLSAFIVALDYETAIVPRGDLRKTPTGTIEASRLFEGTMFSCSSCAAQS